MILFKLLQTSIVKLYAFKYYGSTFEGSIPLPNDFIDVVLSLNSVVIYDSISISRPLTGHVSFRDSVHVLHHSIEVSRV